MTASARQPIYQSAIGRQGRDNQCSGRPMLQVDAAYIADGSSTDAISRNAGMLNRSRTTSIEMATNAFLSPDL
jgi:hypothetical protein